MYEITKIEHFQEARSVVFLGGVTRKWEMCTSFENL